MHVDPDMVRMAEKIARKSPMRVKVAAILVDKRTGKIVAVGYNHHGTRKLNGRWTVHAEVDALNKVRKPSNNLIMILYRSSSRIITPCKACAEVLKAYGIKEVYHTVEVKP
jgi:deoxycytidylate deaminase